MKNFNVVFFRWFFTSCFCQFFILFVPACLSLNERNSFHCLSRSLRVCVCLYECMCVCVCVYIKLLFHVIIFHLRQTTAKKRAAKLSSALGVYCVVYTFVLGLAAATRSGTHKKRGKKFLCEFIVGNKMRKVMAFVIMFKKLFYFIISAITGIRTNWHTHLRYGRREGGKCLHNNIHTKKKLTAM
jgi:hypothetical protein